MRVSLAALCLCMVCLPGCGGAPPTPDAGHLEAARARWPDTQLQDLERGRAAFLARCGGCHPRVDPVDYRPDAWPELVEEMIELQDAEIPASERTPLVQYLVAVSARAQPNAPPPP